jgi:hypothetical protein
MLGMRSAPIGRSVTEVTVDFFERHGAFIISRTATVIHP